MSAPTLPAVVAPTDSPEVPHERRAVTSRAAALVADPWFAAAVRRLVGQGERVVGELLAELAVRHGIENEMRAALGRFVVISDTALDLVGGRELPPAPLTAIDGGRR